MEGTSTFLWETPQPISHPPTLESNSFRGENDIHEDVDSIFRELHGITVEELEVELRRKEKELYLCSKLGLFLAQEVDELVNQRRGIVSDHTRLLLELQEYRDTKRSYLEVSDGASEPECPESTGKTCNRSNAVIDRRESREEGTPVSKLESLQPQVNGISPRSLLERSCSVESLDLVSNAESTMTSASSVRELHHDLDLVRKAHDQITKLEVQLDKTRAKYRSLMTNYAHKLKELSKELGSCVAKARPYFEAVKKAKKCQHETQQAAIEYKRAVNLHKAARDMVKVAEDRVMTAEDKLDPTWQEMLNQANVKVNEASQQKNRVHKVHLKSASRYQVAEEKKLDLQQKLRRNVVKSKPYFDVQREFQDKLEVTTKRLNLLELKLMEARQMYSLNLSRLRKDASGKSQGAMQSLTERGAGVGAETPFGLPDLSSVLPKPAQNFLERESTHSPDGASKSNSDDNNVDVQPSTRTKLTYNPYDLLYLTDIGSDSISNIDSDDDDYLQDF